MRRLFGYKDNEFVSYKHPVQGGTTETELSYSSTVCRDTPRPAPNPRSTIQWAACALPDILALLPALGVGVWFASIVVGTAHQREMLSTTVKRAGSARTRTA